MSPFVVAVLIVGVVNAGEVKVLLVSVSVVARPTKVSVPVGTVIVPELLIDAITGVVKVLLVSVSVVARPTKVSVEVGRVKVPVFEIVLMIGAVKVLLVSVCAVVLSTVVAVSIDKVTAPDDPPPDKPVPAVTPVMSPGLETSTQELPSYS